MSSSPHCEHRRVAIIGSGLAGLSCAVQLAHSGAKVTVFEKLEEPGGRLARHRQAGFAWDNSSGPLTQPKVLSQLWTRLGRKLEDYLELVALPTAGRFFWEDGTRIDNNEEFRKRPDVAGFLNFGKGAYELAEPLLGFHENDWRASFPRILAGLRHLPKLRPGLTLHELTKRFFGDPRLVQLFDHYATRTGSSPWSAPAVLSFFPAIEAESGAWKVKGGASQVIEALLKVAQEQGVEIQTKCEITGVYDSSVAIAGKWQSFDATICNQDVLMAYHSLLPRRRTGEFRDAYLTRFRTSFSSYYLHLGLDCQFPGLDYFNVFFSPDPEQEFRQLVVERVLPEAPTIQLTRCSDASPESAPEGGQSWLIRVSVPQIRSSLKWENESGPFGDRIIERLEQRFGFKELTRHLVVRHALTPSDLRSRFLGFGGSEYGFASHNLRNALIGPQLSPPGTQGFFFAGASMRPTGGISQVLQNADKAVLGVMRYLRQLPAAGEPAGALGDRV